jgi:UDP-glucose 4-epimerase
MEAIKDLTGKRILVTGGTGSLGQQLIKRLLTGELGLPEKITVFSRDEAKQHYMRLEFMHRTTATDDVIYENWKGMLNFRIGDVRDSNALLAAARDTDLIFHAAALKQVPSCEYFPTEAVQTNIKGAENLARAIRENHLPIEAVIGISTDKACKPINVMGMTKALQERILIEANRDAPGTRFMCVRYGNVIASRGSIIPLFVDQINKGLPLTVTMPEMTRFLLTLNKAVDTVFKAFVDGSAGDTFVPKVPSAKITDVARALMGERDLPIVYTGIRPGEKIHEIMISEEECYRTAESGDYFAIRPILPELRSATSADPALTSEYSSKHNNVSVDELKALFNEAGDDIQRFAAAR